MPEYTHKSGNTSNVTAQKHTKKSLFRSNLGENDYICRFSIILYHKHSLLSTANVHIFHICLLLMGIFYAFYIIIHKKDKRLTEVSPLLYVQKRISPSSCLRLQRCQREQLLQDRRQRWSRIRPEYWEPQW